MRYVILLRGVNVGGVTVRMAEVADAFREAGFTEVRTVLASGNVLVTSDADAASVKNTAEQTLRARFGYGAWVHVLTVDAVRRIIDAYPLGRGRDGWRDYVLFVPDAAVRAQIAATPVDAAHERLAVGEGVVYWTVPKGDTLASAVGKLLGKAAFKPHLTSRNLNTLDKLV